MARILVLTLVCVYVLLLLVTPTCSAARTLRESSDRSLSEEKKEFEKRSSKWSDQQSGDDAVPTSSKLTENASKYDDWVRFLEEQSTQDYGDTPAAANPSIPCC